jgi:hypothetical protein
MVGFRQPMLDAVDVANHVEAHRLGIDGVPVLGPLGDVDVEEADVLAL